MKFVSIEDIKADNNNGFQKGLGKFMRITHIDMKRIDRVISCTPLSPTTGDTGKV